MSNTTLLEIVADYFNEYGLEPQFKQYLQETKGFTQAEADKIADDIQCYDQPNLNQPKNRARTN